MGLDMYLTGHKTLWPRFDKPEQARTEDGLRIVSLDLEIGYWRKHPNLHGFIVQAFAEGKDNCQEIMLDPTAIRCIMSAVTEGRLPRTTGFFFGASDGSEKARDLEIFQRALSWLEAGPHGEVPKLGEEKPLGDSGLVMAEVKIPAVMPTESRHVHYRASW